MESMVLGAAFSSLALVWSAYSRVRSNKERCGQLKSRCDLIYDRLHSLLLRHSSPTPNGNQSRNANLDERIVRRVKDLEETFKMTAVTITKVGGQNYLISVLKSEENAALIEDTQRALTELVSLMTVSRFTILSVKHSYTYRADPI